MNVLLILTQGTFLPLHLQPSKEPKRKKLRRKQERRKTKQEQRKTVINKRRERTALARRSPVARILYSSEKVPFFHCIFMEPFSELTAEVSILVRFGLTLANLNVKQKTHSYSVHTRQGQTQEVGSNLHPS